MNYYLGIDGGGTSTRLLIIDENKNIIAFHNDLALNIYQIGREKVSKLLPILITKICKKADILVNDITYAFIGITGYGEVEQDSIFFQKLVNSIFNNVTCGNDIHAAWAGSLAAQAGIHIICGTGSIVYAQNTHGEESRCGGWGHFFGDESSGYWIGQQVFNLFSKQSDGRVHKSYLLELIREKFELSNDFEIIKYYETDYNNNKTNIASLAPLLFESIRKGDESAYEILKQNIYEQALMISTVKNNLSWDIDQIPVSYSGGVFKSKDIIMPLLQEKLSKFNTKLILSSPLLTPIIGAAYYAYLLSDRTFALDDIKTLDQFNSIYY